MREEYFWIPQLCASNIMQFPSSLAFFRKIFSFACIISILLGSTVIRDSDHLKFEMGRFSIFVFTVKYTYNID